MCAEIAGEREVFVADLAFVRLVAGVDVHVILQVGRLAEASIADLALEWPASIVDVHVRLEIARSGEAF